MFGQIKSQERVSQHGEVFTALREVNAMLYMTEPRIGDIDCTVLDIIFQKFAKGAFLWHE